MHFLRSGQPLDFTDFPPLRTAYLSRGIFSVEDLGQKNATGLEFKAGLQRENSGFKIRTSGQALFKKGTYGGFLGKGVSGKDEITKTISALALAGVDFIKVINSGIVLPQGKNPVTEGGFSHEEWNVIREEAGRHELQVRCHANTDPLIRQAVAFGVSSIEHGFFISRETLHWMVEKKISWTPTVFALLSIKPFLSREERGLIEKIVDNHLKAVYYGASLGVKLQVGTDSGSKGVRPGESFFKELQLWKRAGLSFEQIISAACLGREEIEKGNYLVVKSDFIEKETVDAIFIGNRCYEINPAPKGCPET